MKYKFIQLIKMASKYSCYVLLLQCAFMSVVAASDVTAQYKSVREVKLDDSFKGLTLVQAFEKIESKTDFKFYYHGDDLNKLRKLNFTAKDDQTVADILTEISKLSKLKFKQVNNQIGVFRMSGIRKLRTSQPVEVLRTVRGKVSDESGAGLPGVNVLIKGSTVGSVTDVDGNFAIDIPDETTTLVFSYIGYFSEEQEVPAGQTTVNVTLLPNITELQEVVVTAFGIEKETKRLGYSVTEIAGKEVTETREPVFINALAGKIAGVAIQSANNGLAGSTRVIIRGNASFNNNQPLYVIDGVPIDNTLQGEAGTFGGVDRGDGLISINPDDIESMSVLKGPAAGALYGNRAQNGVVLITTKKGRSGNGVGVEFNSNTVFEKVRSYTEDDLQTTYGGGFGGGLFGDQATGSSVNNGWSWGARIDTTDTYVDFDGIEKPYELNTINDNFDRFFETGLSTTNSLAVSGGNENSTYRLSLSQTHTESPFPNSANLDRYNISLRATSKFGEKLSTDVKIDLSRTDAENRQLLQGDGRGAFGLTFFRLTNTTNVLDLDQRDDNGNFIFAGSGTPNPWFAAERVGQGDIRNRINGFLSVKYDFTDWLALQVRGGLDRSNIDEFFGVRPNPNADGGGNYSESRTVVEEANVDFLLLLDKDLSESFNLSGTFGGNHRSAKFNRTSISGRDFVDPSLLSLSNLKVRNLPGFNRTIREVNSFFGALQLGYKNYLFLEATARNDWSSSLTSIRPGSSDNSLFYPSVSLSFAFTDAFDIGTNILSFGKVRASWAQVGSDADPHRTELTFLLTPETNGLSGAQINGGSLPPTTIRPEETDGLEAGLDLRFLENRIGLDVAVYRQETRDFLLSQSISRSTGFTGAFLNAGSMVNKGIEVLLTGTPVEAKRPGGFSWNVAVNWAKNRNEVTDLNPELEESGVSHGNLIRSKVGYPFASIFGTPLRRDQNGNIVYRVIQDDIAGETVDRVVPDEGSYIFGPNGEIETDENGNAIIENEVFLGSPNPDWIGGITNTFTYKGFTLNTVIDAQWGGKVFSSSYRMASLLGITKATERGRQTDEYIPDGVINTGTLENPNFVTNNVPFSPENTYINGNPGLLIDELFVFDNSFVKFRQLSLGYTFSKSLLESTPFQSATLSFVARNLFFITKKVPLVDPDSSTTVGNGFGFEQFSLPASLTLGFNLNIRL
ncbi:SusC/RagA family TonB-linked outer membrane protein [Fulvivirgaceae bacterium BMA12]|uniref:SusC/RagA family TonB-linked outer membrane protein n=1 Tax=Agaribacillus aureus TaxID=3051825 RepID=A0ABT8L7H3_9BACT|nr:SusC/RagA family TonB-linked outer membrane protein [Fulvivirgaceae bacterium BMA12]